VILAEYPLPPERRRILTSSLEDAIVQVFREQNAYGVELFEALSACDLVDASAHDLELAPETPRLTPGLRDSPLAVRARLRSSGLHMGCK
jgi:hypothetical protein